MRKTWTTKDIMYYYNKSSNQIAKWRKEGLKCTPTNEGYLYNYSDIVEFLSE